MTRYGGAHRFDPDPVIAGDRFPMCRVCVHNRSYRWHQPLWWRFLHPLARSR